MLDAKGSVFLPEEYIDAKLGRTRWKRPRTRVYGILAPQWVIDEFEKKLERRQTVKEKLEYCDAVVKLKRDS